MNSLVNSKPIRYFALPIFLLTHSIGMAQSCPDFPVDCADNETMQQDAEKRWQGAEDYKVKEEYVMQDNLRQFFKSMMAQMSSSTHWRVFQYDEFQESGIGNNDKPLAYAYRRPCMWEISFIFVVSEDSLHAWQSWYNNDLKAKSDAMVDAYKQSAPSEDVNKMFSDSVDYYSARKAKYMEDNFPAYQKALGANDQKGIKKYESGLKKYDDDIDGFTKRLGAKAGVNHGSLEQQGKDLDAYKHLGTDAHRNATMVRVSFKVNEHTSPSYDDIHFGKDLALPGATISKLMHNDKTVENEVFGSYTRATDFAIAFFGKWITKLNEYNCYNAVYRSDPKNTDGVTVKKIPCDKIQTIEIHVEGSPKYINQFLKLLDTQKINSLIVKQ